MTDPEKRGDEPACDLVHCRRTQQDYDPAKHTQCPYCFGEEKDVATGDYEVFCDFKPGKDPVSFGFPEDSSRHTRG